ncbi:hypothetical protein EEB14_37650 [Rhodococcus sp. WS4]|nr:hypothetical protein EEB14_37650 [Rhodococcus sp. WS4]
MRREGGLRARRRVGRGLQLIGESHTGHVGGHRFLDAVGCRRIRLHSGPGRGGDDHHRGLPLRHPHGVGPGAQVTVENDDTVEHSVTADRGGAFGRDVDGGGTAVFTAPTQSGAYPVHCTYHPQMQGVLVVVALHRGQK